MVREIEKLRKTEEALIKATEELGVDIESRNQSRSLRDQKLFLVARVAERNGAREEAVKAIESLIEEKE